MKQTLNIDQLLERDGQKAIAKVVATLPEESVSMVWRSGLNETLRKQVQANRRRRYIINFLSPVAGFGLACALAVAVFVKPATLPSATTMPAATTSSSLEASLVRVHQDDMRTADVAGSGLNPVEAASNVSYQQSNSWTNSQDDLEL